MDIQAMIAAATAARDNAYAPYSNHPVGAAILTDDGRLFAGGNVENATHPCGQCAEASAIGAMVAAGGRHIKVVVVVGPGTVPCTPCGNCRQRLWEFGGQETQVYICDSEKVLMQESLGALLPHAFGPRNVAEVAPTGEG